MEDCVNTLNKLELYLEDRVDYTSAAPGDPAVFVARYAVPRKQTFQQTEPSS